MAGFDLNAQRKKEIEIRLKTIVRVTNYVNALKRAGLI